MVSIWDEHSFLALAVAESHCPAYPLPVTIAALAGQLLADVYSRSK